jgi:mannosyl-oligosaccharide alpha-1,2-mannosidase
MGFLVRRLLVASISAVLLILAFRQLSYTDSFPLPTSTSSPFFKGPVKWKDIPLRYPVSSTISLPSGQPSSIPRIQHEFGEPTEHHKAKNKARMNAVKDVFTYSWDGYKKYAWLQDEVMPVTGGFKNSFGARAATLVDTLDTLILMGMDDEFNEALKAIKKTDFSTSMDPVLNVFETTIRYLGGLLSAYDLSEKKHRVLLDKAKQLGDMLYMAFDTPNRLPITRWDWAKYVL